MGSVSCICHTTSNRLCRSSYKGGLFSSRLVKMKQEVSQSELSLSFDQITNPQGDVEGVSRSIMQSEISMNTRRKELELISPKGSGKNGFCRQPFTIQKQISQPAAKPMITWISGIMNQALRIVGT